MPLIRPSNLNGGSSSSSANGASSNGPISVNDLVAKQAASNESKPRFLSKKERLAQAEKTKQLEEEEIKRKERERRIADEERIWRQKEKLREEERARHEAARSGPSSQAGSSNLSYRSSSASSGQQQRRPPPPSSSARAWDAPTGPRAERAAMPPPTHPASAAAADADAAGMSSTSQASHAANAAVLSEAEQEKIRSKYLGIQEKHRKKTRKELGSDRKNMFGWDTKDDTSESSDLVYQSMVPLRGLKMGGTEGETRTQSGRTTSKALQTFSTPAHWSEKSLEEMKERDWRIFREDFGISARGGHIPRPLRSWQESDIPPLLLDAIAQIGYTEPSPIQRQAIPIGLKERDLIGIAETGSGKTASFVIPMLSYISRLPRMDESNKHLGPYALILAPTRELAQQIQVETSRFTRVLGYNCVSIVGGRDMNEQAVEMSRGAEIVIATPGRLKDCVDRHVVVLGQCAYVVMDEADRMVNLGFEDVLNYILDSLPVSNVKPDSEAAELGGDDLNENMGVVGEGGRRYRVTMLYSATMPPSVDRMARKYLRRPATITIGDANQAVGTVVQSVEFVSGDDKKKSRLLQILASGFEPPIIVFSTTRQSVDAVAKDIMRAGYNCTTLHAGKSQDQREEALQSLRNGDAPILVATDLAGRGIDVPDVSLVINFSMPTMFESYIHRIGRTGRAGKKGHAITFLENTDQEWYYDLRLELERSPVSTVPRELEKHPASQQRMTREMMKRKRDDD